MRRNGKPPAEQVRAADMVQREAPDREVYTFQPLPTPPGSPPFKLATTALDIAPSGDAPRVLHVIGDDGGISNPKPQQAVIAAMIADLKAHPEVAFCWHVGDWAYFNGGEKEWVAQQYETRNGYDRVLVGNPGNHDGDPEEDGEPSLSGFVRYQCDQQAPRLLPEIAEYGRDTVQQPNVYWTLDDDAVTIVALYTNVPEGGQVEPDQEAWFIEALKAAPTGKPLIVSLHHPLFSVDAYHGGSKRMGELIERCCKEAGRWPDAIISGHVHDYQRFEWTIEGRTIPCFVIGASGYHNLHAFAKDVTDGMEAAPGVKFCAGEDKQWGFLRLSIANADGIHNLLQGEYVGVAEDGTVTPALDTFSYPLGD